MSFILDALKKSESARQRQSGPALFEVTVARPRTRLPPWAIAIAALLAINLVIVTWMLVRHSTRAEGNSAAPPAVSGDAAPRAAPAPLAAVTASVTGAPAGAAAPQSTAPPVLVPSSPPAPPLLVSAGSAGTAATPAAQNPEDYVPAAEEPALDSSRHVRRGTAEGVPLYQDVAATPGTQIPQLRLDLHVYAARPEDRFVMINMHKLREGDSLADGVHVDSITTDGAVLSYNGSRFLLPRD